MNAESRYVRAVSASEQPTGHGGRWDLVELSHVIADGMVTYPGLPAPQVSAHLTRDASRKIYAPGTEFTIDVVTMVGNTGTYVDSPYHRYADGADLAGLGQLPVSGARFTAAPPRFAGFGTFPVRAFAAVPAG